MPTASNFEDVAQVDISIVAKTTSFFGCFRQILDFGTAVVPYCTTAWIFIREDQTRIAYREFSHVVGIIMKLSRKRQPPRVIVRDSATQKKKLESYPATSFSSAVEQQ
ncbi:hypothetical protein KM043_014672 [Ampulex compressa]|nr:hypothetical protein KM043_014672 [Ampulex compressa]